MSDELTVAHLVATTGATGVEAHLRVLFEGLREVRVRAILLCPRPGPLTEAMSAAGHEVRFAAPRSRAGVFELPALARALGGTDLLHAHGPRAQWWSAVLRRSGAAHRAVATIHEFGRSGLGSRAPSAWFGPIERWTLTVHDRLIAVSGAIRQRVVHEGGIAAERIDVIPNSSPPMLSPPRPLEPPAEPPYALAAARFNREKGLDVLLEAVGLLAPESPALRFRILGEGVERAALERKARELGIEALVEFPGWAFDVPEQMRGALFYLNPSRDEPCSVAVLEAMSLGVPIVGTTVGGNVELLAGVDDPPLVPPDDPRALADAIRTMTRMPGPRREQQRRILQERAYREFSPTVMARATRSTYDHLLSPGDGA